MSVFETVADLVQQIRAARQGWQGEWDDSRGVLAWMDDDGADLIVIPKARTCGTHSEDAWLTHPAVFLVADEPRTRASQEVALASWALDDGALDAVLAAEVDPEYARAAQRAGVTDAWQLIEAWRDGIPIEFLSALAGDVWAAR
ncbi:hypothetical protein [Microbacterium sp. Leaf203]|uniref:hypothetical protein n=1 Tax=Microbacterium sp. Leaf203 TaxID=1735677 RepID=UPI0006F5F5A5|nr:hypothetical protein [Microbacterium sp. Leaf203]KQM36860.1 hypothetical protein ASE56_10625 [Microbacterium sp. Leaf203]